MCKVKKILLENADFLTLIAMVISAKILSFIWDKDFRINFHVRRVACDDVTISRALLLYEIAYILLSSGRKQ